MRDEAKTKQQLIAELEELRRRVAENVDITERKRAEEALRESEQRFRMVLENSVDAAYLRNLTSDACDYMSPAIETLTRFTSEEMARMSVAEMLARIHPDDVSRVSNEVAGLAERKTAIGVVEYRFRGKDGQYRWLADRFRVVADAEGHPLYRLGIVRDVTEQRLAEEALQKAHQELERRVEERTAELAAANKELAVFRKFADTSTQGFSMADLDGHITYINPALCRILGEERTEDVIGKHLSTHFSEESNRRGDEEIKPALIREGYWEGEIPMLSRQGTSVPTWHHTFVMRDEQGRPFRLGVAITDVTERKRAEEALRQSHDQLQTIYDGMVEGLLITDIETKRFVRVNSAICRMLGYSEEDLLAASVKDIHPPEEVPNDMRRFQAAAEGRVSINEDRPVLRRDGSIFQADITGRRIVYDGRHCLLALFRDVSERRKAEEALERDRRTLEHLFRSTDHERRLIAYEIHDGLAQLLAGAIMQFDTFAHLKEKKSREAQKVFDAAILMLRQSHAEARRLISGVRPPILDEAGIVTAISHLIHEQREPNGPQIEYHADVSFDRLVPIQENTIYRIVQEALTNACKYSQTEKIRVQVAQRGDDVRIEVQDWGIGFRQDEIGEQCFGLHGIRERTRLLGGKTTIETEPGRGTRVVVEMPFVVREKHD